MADAEAWLADNTNIAATLGRTLGNSLRELWSKAFNIGWQSAEEVTGRTARGGEDALSALLQNYGPAWIREIVSTFMGRIAKILAGGGPLARLEQALEKLLSDAKHAYLIALTEVTRAAAMAASAVYSALGVTLVNWVTAHDTRVCPVCNRNQAASPHPLGVPFPGGAIAPPQHPNCRCALVPA